MTLHRSDKLLHVQFRRQCDLTPSSIAIVDAEKSLTYLDLDRASDKVASALQSEGIGANSIVAVHLDRSIDWIVSVLAILKTNATAMPIPLSFPPDRTKHIFSFASPDLVIRDPSLGPDYAGAMPTMLVSEAVGGNYEAFVPQSGNPQQDAFVLCSSGSTGSPKLIVRNHESFFHRLEWTWSNHPYESTEICCHKSATTTTHSIYELFEPLLKGVPTHIFEEQVTKNLEAFWDSVREQRISRLLLVPSMLQASLDIPAFGAPQIKVLVIMGEHVRRELAARVCEAMPTGSSIYSIYGSTEASSTLIVNLREVSSTDMIPLGTPIAEEIEAVVLDAALKPIELGAIGRLFIGGPCLFSRYLNDESQTESTMMRTDEASPFLFDTSDQVRVQKNGHIEYVGRIDHTVKVRGYRVDLLEIENAILEVANVRQAAVTLSGQGDEATRSLRAYFSPENIKRSTIIEHLQSRLTDYMIPAHLIGIAEIPLTANGKIDRRRLASEHESISTVSSDENLSATEKLLYAIWSDILGHTSFKPTSHFFEAGGTSLTIFSVIYRIRQEFDLSKMQFGEQHVYQYPSISLLAEYIQKIKSGHGDQVVDDAPLTVTLKNGQDQSLAPIFLVASAGGTLGAYQKLVAALPDSRDVVGIRDSFNWNARDPSAGFQSWISSYLEAIRKRQAKGPYYIGAYSSGGAFALELAAQIKKSGDHVQLLALIDPLSLDRSSRRRYGWWANHAIYERFPVRMAVHLAGLALTPVVRFLHRIRRNEILNDYAPTPGEYAELVEYSTNSKNHIKNVAALIELNTDLPFSLSDRDLEDLDGASSVNALVKKFEELLPQVESNAIEQLLVQYTLQVKAQFHYKLSRYDGNAILFQPTSSHDGPIATQFRHYLTNLRIRRIPIEPDTDAERRLANSFGKLKSHYLCIRNISFTKQVARTIDSELSGRP